jgi:diguanylate cyclase (GGDEF)-like protein/PAS domain S-box-containing protein
MHELLQEQLAQATSADGTVDLDALTRLVSATYHAADRDYSRAQRLLSDTAEALDRTKAQLLDAFECVPGGIVLFDSEDRYVHWNRQYAEDFRQLGVTISRGRRFEDVLREAVSRKCYAEIEGKEEEWIAERLARHKRHSCSLELQVPNGRWVRVESRPTQDGGCIEVGVDITELKEREASFRLLFDCNPVPMVVVELETRRILAANDAATVQYGYAREQFRELYLFDIVAPAERDLVRKLAAERKLVVDGEVSRSHITADGRIIHVTIFSRALTYQGKPASLSAIIDVTEEKRAKDELSRMREFLDTVIENVPAPISVKNARDLRYVLVNRAGAERFGCPREDVIGRTAREIFSPQTAEEILVRDREALRARRRHFSDAHFVDTPGQGRRLYATTRLPIAGPDGTPEYLLTFVDDLTERRQAEERIAFLARHDGLTGLPNRKTINEQLEATIKRAESDGGAFALMYVDLDRFKEVNELFGHAVGDALMRAVADRMRNAAEGAFIGRFGGDEFGLIVTGLSQPAAADEFARRLIAAIAEDFLIEGKPVRTGLSIGVAIFPSDGVDAAELLGSADAAVSRAKADGRGTVRFFRRDMDRQLRDRRALKLDLQAAIERGEFILHYQPQALIDGTITGFEALIRWKHSARGMIRPDEFVPIAEESGLIVPIGEWVLREACRQAASWPNPLQVAVNLSPVQFRHGDLPRLLHTVLLETGLAPHRLIFEITEGVLIEDFSRAVSVLRRLKTLGVRIAMDDFGTGYSSLAYLQKFPFDKLKIDRAFIAGVDRNIPSASIVRAVIGMARSLGMPVVAEGVETEGERAFLANEACDQIQGYLVGKPAPIESFAGILALSPLELPRLAYAG